MYDVRQSENFANFMNDLGWKIEKVDTSFVYARKFPFIGYFAKIPRANSPIDVSKISSFKKNHRIFRLKISPNINYSDSKYQNYQKEFLQNRFWPDPSPFSPTTTIQIDLTQNEDVIFDNFVSAKRRGVRRAIKNGILVKESSNIKAFIKIRQEQFSPLGFLITSEMKKLWQNFYPKNAALLLAYQKTPRISKLQGFLAGILLLFYKKMAYYWFASSLFQGKKLFAPTLLVWEALKLSKKRGCKIFDFEGVYDERFPKAAKSWKGFTKFKEGFGGERVTFIENFYL